MAEKNKPLKKHKYFKQIIVTLFFQSLICIVTPVISPGYIRRGTTHILATRVGPCYDIPNLMVSVSEMGLVRHAYDSSLSGKFNISEDIENGWSVTATLQKCHDIRNLDTCDFVKSYTLVPSGCDESNENDPYVMFFNYVEPKLDCPLQAGDYLIKEFPFFTGDSGIKATQSKISTSVFGYTYRLEGFDKDDERILCLEAYLQLIHDRKHEWVLNKDLSDTTTLLPVSVKEDMHEDDVEDNISEE